MSRYGCTCLGAARKLVPPVLGVGGAGKCEGDSRNLGKRATFDAHFEGKIKKRTTDVYSTLMYLCVWTFSSSGLDDPSGAAFEIHILEELIISNRAKTRGGTIIISMS